MINEGKASKAEFPYPVLMQQCQGLAALLAALLVVVGDEGAPDDSPEGVQGGVVRSFDVNQDLLSDHQVKKCNVLALLLTPSNNLFRLGLLF